MQNVRYTQLLKWRLLDGVGFFITFIILATTSTLPSELLSTPAPKRVYLVSNNYYFDTLFLGSMRWLDDNSR